MFDTECRNVGYYDRFTTPCCYIDVKQHTVSCPKCGRTIVCTVEHEPVAVCRVVEAEDDGEGAMTLRDIMDEEYRAAWFKPDRDRSELPRSPI